MQMQSIEATPTSSSRSTFRIVPSLPTALSSPSNNSSEGQDDNSSSSVPEEPFVASEPPSPVVDEALSYSIPPPPQRIEPGESVHHQIYETIDFESDDDDRGIRASQGPDSRMDYRSNEATLGEDNPSAYRLGFAGHVDLQNRRQQSDHTGERDLARSRSTSSDSMPTLPDAYNGNGNRAFPRRSIPPTTREGGTSVSAIVIEDSPTPPLRPLASSQARLAVTATGRCGAIDGEASTANEHEEQKITLGELVCPICLGPPAPLVVTECGHTFCGPCLHAAIVAQPITPQLMQDIPTLAGKDLEGTCPVCRHVLTGGWGRSLRGAIMKMAAVDVPLP